MTLCTTRDVANAICKSICCIYIYYGDTLWQCNIIKCSNLTIVVFWERGEGEVCPDLPLLTPNDIPKEETKKITSMKRGEGYVWKNA